MARTEAVALRREATAAAWWRINATALLFMGPAVLLVLVFFLAPVVITFTMSLTDLATSTGLSNWQWIGLENFARIFRSQFWLTILGNTVVYVAVVLAFNVLVGLGVALLTMHMEPKAGGVFRALWLLPRISPSVVYQTMSLFASYEYIYLTTNGGPGLYATETWSLWAFHTALSNYYGNLEFAYGAAMSAILVLMGLAISIVLLRVFRFGQLVAEPRVEVE